MKKSYLFKLIALLFVSCGFIVISALLESWSGGDVVNEIISASASVFFSLGKFLGIGFGIELFSLISESGSIECLSEDGIKDKKNIIKLILSY
jgi:hypothetical protein